MLKMYVILPFIYLEIFGHYHHIISFKKIPTKTQKQAMPCRFGLLMQSYQINVRSLHQQI